MGLLLVLSKGGGRGWAFGGRAWSLISSELAAVGRPVAACPFPRPRPSLYTTLPRPTAHTPAPSLYPPGQSHADSPPRSRPHGPHCRPPPAVAPRPVKLVDVPVVPRRDEGRPGGRPRHDGLDRRRRLEAAQERGVRRGRGRRSCCSSCCRCSSWSAIPEEGEPSACSHDRSPPPEVCLASARRLIPSDPPCRASTSTASRAMPTRTTRTARAGNRAGRPPRPRPS